MTATSPVQRLRELVEKSRVFLQMDDCFELRFFNIFETGTRALLREHPPLLRPESAGRGLHIVIIGCGDTGESIVGQAARLLNVAEGQRLRITVGDRDTKRKEPLFLRSHPRLAEVCDVEFIPLDVTDPVFVTGEFLADRGGLGGLDTAYVCLESDAPVCRAV